ncbi:Hypothetical predicted protein [Mytilus galloprovincialis]|nr:Hypothetical predicted protein [Mytilus galloprovincialis]
MVEACNYGHLHIVEWLLQNFYHMCLNPQLLMREAGRNGWSNIFLWLIDNYFFKTSNKLMATKEAIVNGKLGIVKLMFSRMSKSDFDISDLPEKTFTDSNNEEVVSFVLHHCDPIKLDISTIMINACKFGWTETVQYILDEKLFSSCDLNLAFAKACENGELEIVKALADKCNLQNLKMEKTIISVCIKGWDEVALFLLDKFEHTRLDIANALIEACRHGEIDVAQAILRKVKHTLLDVKTALDKACENHMHEELVLLILKNINQNQVDLKTVKKQAIRHKWREVQFAIPGVDTEDLNEAEQDTGTDFIVIS